MDEEIFKQCKRFESLLKDESGLYTFITSYECFGNPDYSNDCMEDCFLGEICTRFKEKKVLNFRKKEG